MKRDIGLIRSILLQVERHAEDSAPMQLRIETHSREEVSYHVRLLAQAGYIDAMCTKALADVTWVPMGFTWKGHELLDDIRDEAVWTRVKELVDDKGESASLAVLHELAIDISKQRFGLRP